MTDRELLLSLQAQIAAHLGAVIPGPVDPVKPVEPPPPPPAVGVDPAVAAKIHAAITELRAKGMDWPDIGFWLQTQGGIHMGGAGSPEWEVAYAAGYPRPEPSGGGGGGKPRPVDDLTGYEDGDFIPQRPFPSGAVRWTSRSHTGPARFVLVEETHPSRALEVSATVTDSTGAVVGTASASRLIPQVMPVPFDAVAGRTYYLTVTADGPFWRHVELRTR